MRVDLEVNAKGWWDPDTGEFKAAFIVVRDDGGAIRGRLRFAAPRDLLCDALVMSSESERRTWAVALGWYYDGMLRVERCARWSAELAHAPGWEPMT